MGYYAEGERNKKRTVVLKSLRKAKVDLLEALVAKAGLAESLDAAAKADSRFFHYQDRQLAVLDVGCGLGGSSRFLAEKVGFAGRVTGVTTDATQAARGTLINRDRGVENCELRTMASPLVGDYARPGSLDFPDESFDLVFACEGADALSPGDKRNYIEEMTRVLKPGGKLVMSSWCKRPEEFDFGDWGALDFLSTPEWSTVKPQLVAIQDFADMLAGTQAYSSVEASDWSEAILPTFRHSASRALLRPSAWRALRGGEKVHQAFNGGFLQYGVLCATKKPAAA